ncbi:MAG: glutamine synthetase [Actinomycetales bacterium]|nr:glutamine synthetase [Actinomycetales bacterium]
MTRPQPLTPDSLRAAVEDGAIDTVAVALTDMQGRLQGKRIDADFFLEDVMGHHTEGCNYLLAVDVDMNTVDGYAMSSWDTGYGDMVMRPDLSTLHRVPWQPGTAGVLCDLVTEQGEPVKPSPRQVLKAQLERLHAADMEAYVGTELEFIVFQDTYEEAWLAGYHNLTPANLYNVDYSMLGTARVEPLLRRIRRSMAGAGMTVESAKGECNFGQHEIAFKYQDALRTCDNHSIYKNGAKEIAAQEDMSLTFMAKYNEREGNSCHIHLSVRGRDGSTVMADHHGDYGLSPLGRAFIAGQLAHARELTLMFAPQINSYKRYVEGSFAPTAIRWGQDNRTCAFRLVGHGPSLRVENRVPGGDVNPYLAVAGMVAAGIDGIERDLALEDPFVGNAYHSDSTRVPTSMAEALGLWESSEWVRDTFGAEVQEHYANMARVELAAFGSTVTNWERFRGFERL